MGTSRLALAIVATIAGIAVSAAGATGSPVFHEHENFTDTFADNFCGISGTSVVRGVDDFKGFPNGQIMDNFQLTQTFTAADSGKSIVLHVAQRFTSNEEPIDNGDGTVSFVQSFTGLPEQLRLANGRVLLSDRGTVVFTRIFDATTFDFISQTVSGEKGPHPDLDSDFAAFCDVVIPALS